MSSRAAAILIVVVVALAATLMSMFTVSETELATQSSVDGPGPETAQLTTVEPAPNPDTLVLRLADRP